MHYSDKNRFLDNISKRAISQILVDLPDYNITLAYIHSYGYTNENMLSLTKNMAQKHFDMETTVYMPHYDDTETMVLDADAIERESK